MTGNAVAIRCRTFRLPKRGHAAEEYEDASAVDPCRGRFAIADGAAESSFACLWARLLVDEFVRAENTNRWEAGLPQLRTRWAAEACGSANGGATPWYFDQKLQQGAFATFLGLSIRGLEAKGRRQRRLSATAVGDSCLFQLRQGRLVKAFPLAKSAEFGNAPGLIESRSSTLLSMDFHHRRFKSHWRPDDRLWLMTDALAQWFLKEVEDGGRPWDTLDGLANDAQFATCVEDLRDRGGLRNDDVTALTIHL
jgi:hypothetical protein